MNSNVSVSTVIGALVRTVLSSVAGGLITDGIVTADQVNLVAGGITVVLVAGWSLWQKRQAAKKAAN